MLDDATIRAIVAGRPIDECRALFVRDMVAVTGYDHDVFNREYLFWSTWKGTNLEMAKASRYCKLERI